MLSYEIIPHLFQLSSHSLQKNYYVFLQKNGYASPAKSE